ncbi:MAG: hypothetical protein ACREV2_07855, partial [Burkholderiales bacterium]
MISSELAVSLNAAPVCSPALPLQVESRFWNTYSTTHTGEMGIIGNEGAVGIAMFMGGGTMPNQAIVQGTGDSFRIKT